LRVPKADYICNNSYFDFVFKMFSFSFCFIKLFEKVRKEYYFPLKIVGTFFIETLKP